MKNIVSVLQRDFSSESTRAWMIGLAIIATGWMTVFGCTSALVGMERGADGRWLLWKHRDSGHPDNYVRCFAATDSTMAYVGLFNAADTAASEVWTGFNEAGFAVMNTASYNIPAPSKDWQDREGLLMTDALRNCRSLNDFHRMLIDFPGKRGVQANFGAFDAEGHGAYFEVSDRHVDVFPIDSISAISLGVRMPVHQAPTDISGIITRTNYSFSGGKSKRLGVSRHHAERHLLDSLITVRRPWADPGKIAAEDLIEVLSRSLYLPAKGIDLLDGRTSRFPDTGDAITRRSSCASVVIEGPLPGENPAKTVIMWTAIGSPALSVMEAVTLDSVPAGLLPSPARNFHSSICDSVNILRDKAFLPSKAPAKRGGKRTYDFNLPFLRDNITSRRVLSLGKYAAPRNRRANAKPISH